MPDDVAGSLRPSSRHVLGHRQHGVQRPGAAERGRSHGLSTIFLQSNKEGELVEFLQEARTGASAVILNAAAYTHTSVAILDALQTLKQPVIEVHLSNPARREDFRHLSYVAKAATGIIAGLGVNSYLLAIDAVAAILAGAPSKKK